MTIGKLINSLKNNPLTLIAGALAVVLVVSFVPAKERGEVMTTIAKSAGSSVLVKGIASIRKNKTDSG